MTGYSLNGLLFLIEIPFDFFIFVLIMRLILALTGADYSHPIAKLTVNLTSVIVRPFKKILPDIRHFETATFVLILVFEMIKFLIKGMLSYGIKNMLGLPILAFGDSLSKLFLVFSFAIFIQALVSIMDPNSSIIRVLDKLTSPILNPLRRLIPTVGGYDLSPIPAIIFLQLLIILVCDPIVGMGYRVLNGT